jgi:hypothetical protein
MPQLSEHFAQSEFEIDTPLPPETIPIVTELCVNILEPVRSLAGGPLITTSADRPAAVNQATGGVCGSDHIYTAQHCAWDGHPADRTTTRTLFEAVCASQVPKIPFDQCILEFNAAFPDDVSHAIIHLSHRSTPPRRMALIGSEYGASGYTHVAVAA